MIEDFIVSKIIDWGLTELVGKKRIERLKERIGLDEHSKIGKEALERTIRENDEYLRLLNFLRERGSFEVKKPSEIKKKDVYSILGQEAEKRLFDEFFKSLEVNYRNILSERADRIPETSMILEKVQKLEKTNKNVFDSRKKFIVTIEPGGSEDNITLKAVPIEEAKSRIPFLAPPRPPLDLVGRESLLHDLKQELLAGRDIAIQGLPGVGKTAIAVELAHDAEVTQYFKDGILWAGIGRGSDISAHLGAWSQQLGIYQEEIADFLSIEDRLRALRAAIGMRRMLIIIDDAWEARDALILKLGCPNCAHIITTRSPEVALYFANEVTPIHELNENDSLKLLRQLVGSLVDAEPDKTKELVQAVGGLPLALVIMGSYLRVKAHSGQPRRLRSEIDRLLKTKERLQVEIPKWPDYFPNLSEKSFLSLVAVISISDKALDESSRHALRTLSVFPPKPNTFSEDAALAVSNDTIEAIDTLTDYGLVEVIGTDRFTVHKAIADYAKLNLVDEESVLKRMATFFVRYVNINKDDYDALDKEIGNILLALEAANKLKMKEAVIEGVNSFCRYLDTRGLYEKAETHLSNALNFARILNKDTDLIMILYNIGIIESRKGKYTQAEKYFKEGLVFAEKTGDDERISSFLMQLGAMAYAHGYDSQASEYYHKGLEVARRIEHHGNIVDLLTGLALLVCDQGDHKQAETYSKEGLALVEGINYYYRMIWLFDILGLVKIAQGNYRKARGYFRKGLKIARRIGHRERMSNCLMELGVASSYLGYPSKTEEYIKEGLVIAREIRHRERISICLMNLGALAFFRGNYEQAQNYLEEGLNLAREIGNPSTIIDILTNFGDLELRRGNYGSALEYIEEGLSLARQVGMRKSYPYCLMILGEIQLRYGNYKQAEKQLKKGLDLAREIRHQAVIMDLLGTLGDLELKRGDRFQAEKYIREEFDLARKTGRCRGIIDALRRMGELEMERESYNLAEEYLEQGLVLVRRTEYAEDVMDLLKTLGDLEFRCGNHEQAEKYLEEGLELARKIGYLWFISAISNYLGEIRLKKRNLESASAAFQDALEVARKLGEKELIAFALYGLARVAFAQNNRTEACQYGQEGFRILEEIDHHRKATVKEWLFKTLKIKEINGNIDSS
jgi:tetratricopeptide (TPR) repeat protein